jgi:hypothetical protein
MSSSMQKSVIVLVLHRTYIQSPTSMLCDPMGSHQVTVWYVSYQASSLYTDCKNIRCMNNIKMYKLNGSSQGEPYSSLHISQLTCVIITMAIWNNPAMNSQAKQNCR